jgi:hypothetical protein
MKNFLSVIGLSFLVLNLFGCSSNEPEETSEKIENLEVEENVTVSDFSQVEQITLDFINIHLNSDDFDKKEQFVNENVHEGMISIHLEKINEIKDENERFYNPEVISSVDYLGNGFENSKLTLVNGNNNSGDEIEGIAFFIEEKFNWFYQSDDEQNAIYEELRAVFE